MINESVDRALFDSILGEAFRAAAEADMREKPDCGTVVLTKAQLKAERLAYDRREAKSRRGRGWHNALTKAASVILIIGCVGFAALMAVPPVRAAAVEVIVRAFDKYTAFHFEKTSESGDGSGEHTENVPYAFGEYTLGYIPDGFELAEKYENKITCMYVYLGENECKFRISYTPADATMIELDNEQADISELTVNGFRAFLSESKNADKVILIFNDGSNVFNISGNLPKEEIIRIAENIK